MGISMDKIKQLEKKIDRLESDIDEAEDNLDDLKDRLDEVKALIRNLENTTGSNYSSVNNKSSSMVSDMYSSVKGNCVKTGNIASRVRSDYEKSSDSDNYISSALDALRREKTSIEDDIDDVKADIRSMNRDMESAKQDKRDEQKERNKKKK